MRMSNRTMLLNHSGIKRDEKKQLKGKQDQCTNSGGCLVRLFLLQDLPMGSHTHTTSHTSEGGNGELFTVWWQLEQFRHTCENKSSREREKQNTIENTIELSTTRGENVPNIRPFFWRSTQAVTSLFQAKEHDTLSEMTSHWKAAT